MLIIILFLICIKCYFLFIYSIILSFEPKQSKDIIPILIYLHPNALVSATILSKSSLADPEAGRIWMDYYKACGRRISFEYTLIAGKKENDSDAVRVLVEEGDEFNVEQKNMGTNKVDIKISKDGVLSITNKDNLIGIFSGISFRKNSFCPTVIITLPRNLFLENLIVDMGGGSFEARTINLTSKSARLTVGAGQIVLKDLTFLGKQNKLGEALCLVIKSKVRGGINLTDNKAS